MIRPEFPEPTDLRTIRTTFLAKRQSYVFSYEYQLKLEWYSPGAADVGLRLHLIQDVSLNPGKVFHVLDQDRVPGLDGLGHDVPVDYQLHGINDQTVIRPDQGATTYGLGPNGALQKAACSAGIMSGRMFLEAPAKKKDEPFPDRDGDAPLRIALTYDGVVQLARPMVGTAGPPVKTLQGRAFVTTFFETDHPKYHWLCEATSIAFGTWKLAKQTLDASFDVYILG